MTEPPPLVTVIVPVRDRSAMLADLLDSLLAQTFPAADMELIVTDGDSREPLAEQVAAFAARAPFAVRYLKVAEDRGPVSKRNLAAREARGTLLAFTDSDCRTTPDWLNALTAPFADREVGFVSGPVTYKPEQPKQFFSKLTAETLVEHPTYPTANIAYRRDLFLAMNGFDETLGVKDFLGRATECGDTDLAWRIRKAGWKNVFAPQALILHEVEPLTPMQWLLEPTRLILLPQLVKLHPEIAPKLLRWNTVFYPGTLIVYGAILALVLLLALTPQILPVVVLAGLVGLWAWKVRAFDLARTLAVFRDAGLHFARMSVMAATLIAGSLRYGRVVV